MEGCECHHLGRVALKEDRARKMVLLGPHHVGNNGEEVESYERDSIESYRKRGFADVRVRGVGSWWLIDR
jgi:hypothetical protein